MKVLWLLLVFNCSQHVGGEPKPLIHCLYYIPEHKGSVCRCTQPSSVHGPVKLWWPGYSNISKLAFHNVNRKENGTQYTCSMTAYDGKVVSAVYTLRVAYGLSNNNLAITGPREIVTNGLQNLNLTCTYKNMYPTPHFHWSGITCQNTVPESKINTIKDGMENEIYTVPENICTVNPIPPIDDGKTVTCTATMRSGPDLEYWKHPPGQANTTFELTLLYPPLSKPDIQPLPSQHNLEAGGTLTCTVRGGKPQVDSVNFYCLNPHLPDQDDEFIGTTVMSTLVLNITKTKLNNMECFCEALWSRRKQYYKLQSTAVYSSRATREVNILLVILAASSLLFAFATVIVVIIVVRRRLRRSARGPYTENVLIQARNVQAPTDVDSSTDSNSDQYIDVDEEDSDEEQHASVQRRPLPPIPVADAEVQESTDLQASQSRAADVHVNVDEVSNAQDHQQHNLSNQLQATPSHQLPEAGIPLTCLSQDVPADPDTEEETEMNSSYEVPGSRGDYEPMEETSDGQQYMYTNLDRPLSVSYQNVPLADANDSDSEDEDFIYPIFKSSAHPPYPEDDYGLRFLFEKSDMPPW